MRERNPKLAVTYASRETVRFGISTFRPFRRFEFSSIDSAREIERDERERERSFVARRNSNREEKTPRSDRKSIGPVRSRLHHRRDARERALDPRGKRRSGDGERRPLVALTARPILTRL